MSCTFDILLSTSQTSITESFTVTNLLGDAEDAKKVIDAMRVAIGQSLPEKIGVTVDNVQYTIPDLSLGKKLCFIHELRRLVSVTKWDE